MNRYDMRNYCSAMLLLGALSIASNAVADAHKQIVGATEVIRIEEADFDIKARVDTGARTSSIHAENIRVEGSGNPEGKAISFYLVNRNGQSRKIETRVSSVVTVRTSEGSERRYKVPLTLEWKNTKKTILLTLNDRSEMEYRLLLGRNWLQQDFLVDVDINSED